MMIIFKEIQSEIKTIKSENKQIRNFAFVFAAFFLVLIYFFKNQWLVLSLISLFFIMIGTFLPKWLLGFYIVWMSVAVVLSYFVFRLFLAVFYIFVIIPFGLLSRIFRKDFLNKDFKKRSRSYWVKHSGTNNPEEPY